MDLLSPTVLWLLVALVSLVFELFTGAYVLLAIALAAALTSVGAWLGLDLIGQLAVLAVGCGILVPLAIHRLKHRPHKSDFGVAGAGAGTGQHFVVTLRDYDSASCIKLDGDLYRAVLETQPEAAPSPGDKVVLVRFDGNQAIVSPAP
ncbi:hypothetical protein HCU01_21760 [Halomonas cupida]|uniref:Membrane protein implicated in regulation of membrane protease activity n=1 Tax=Halomonas cupida TaxID=44933 RepID=A0A1M7IXH9_9GAMM|nr:hypothetical protein [Halomonas cupida]GEN24227.1 hypothetical protein HCU01_21760 [Halomonas cupida]SHM45412.1 Membrane protein implicated in regulation of membrane protease activity [Halomonas cupida]